MSEATVEMAACEWCQGEGIQRVPRSGIDPMFNVAGLALIDNVWTGTCRGCRGKGIFEWTRGVSLPPFVPLAKLACP